MFEGKAVQALADRVGQLAADLRAAQARCDQLEAALSQQEADLKRVRADQLLLGRRLDEAETQSGKAMTGLLERIEQLRGLDALGARAPRPA